MLWRGLIGIGTIAIALIGSYFLGVSPMRVISGGRGPASPRRDSWWPTPSPVTIESVPCYFLLEGRALPATSKC
jgi:hypothetical protein